MKDWIHRVVLILCVVVFCYGAFQVYRIYHMYNQAEETFVDLAQEALVEGRTPAGEQQELPEDYPMFSVDFADLKAASADIIGWIYLGQLGISYPILQGDTNETYLRTDIYGNYSKPGCIFVNADATDDFSDPLTFVFGHNMKNGSMFGGLKTYYQDMDFVKEHPYFYILQESGVKRYQIFAFENLHPEDSLYTIPGEDGLEDYIGSIREKALWYEEPELMAECISDKSFDTLRICNLSTCYKDGNNRFLVHGVLVEEKQDTDFSQF